MEWSKFTLYTVHEELFNFLAALEYPLGLESCTTLDVLRAWSRCLFSINLEDFVANTRCKGKAAAMA